MVGINGEEWDVEKIGGPPREALGVWRKKQIRVRSGIRTGFWAEQAEKIPGPVVSCERLHIK